jgi:uncharacterized membrane protein
MSRIVVCCVILYCVALGFNLSTSLPNDGINGIDIVTEYNDSLSVINNGWHITDTYSHNNTTITIGIIIPFLAKFIPINLIFKVVFPVIFSLTPPLLFLFYRKFMGNISSFIGALFFALLLPTWQEVPAISKSELAEPLAVCALIVLFSDIKAKYLITSVLVIVTILAHYTVGFLLIFWIVAMFIMDSIQKQKVSKFLIPSVIAILFSLIWFKIASNGVVLYHSIKDMSVNPNTDPIVNRVVGETWGSEPASIKAQIIILYISLLVLVVGLVYIIRNYRQMDKRLLIGMIVCSIGIIGGILLPKWFDFILVTRWVQYGAILLSPVFAFGIEQIWRWLKSGYYRLLIDSV